MNEFIDQYNFKEKMYDSKVKSSWEELMGKTIAKYTSKVFINKKTLFIKLLSNPLRHELEIQKQDIQNKINGFLGEPFIERVVVR